MQAAFLLGLACALRAPTRSARRGVALRSHELAVAAAR